MTFDAMEVRFLIEKLRFEKKKKNDCPLPVILMILNGVIMNRKRGDLLIDTWYQSGHNFHGTMELS